MITFGPIPSRRLGNSLGINNIPPKICTYSCAYCQQGYSTRVQVERQTFYEPEKIFQDVKLAVENASKAGNNIDYLTIVPDGEPTLDINLGKIIDMLKPLGIKIAVINNASLLYKPDVRNDLAKADWVSVKVDSVNETTWRKIDHPSRQLELPVMLEGIRCFAREFTGQLCTETMLVKGLNDSLEEAKNAARFIGELKPSIAYILVPTRPPADKSVLPPDEKAVISVYDTFTRYLSKVQYLIGYEGNDFASTGDPAEDILSITAVHPMREDAVQELLSKTGSNWRVVDKLIAEQKLLELNYGDKKFYMRKLYENYKR